VGWQWLENDHRNLEKNQQEETPSPEKKDVASTALRRKETVIHR
jgi:hypothetical protein